MDREKREFIEFMMEAEALKFGEFITKSGRKSPYFINSGVYSKGSQITKLGEFYSKVLMKKMNLEEIKVLFGPAYKGIPLAVSTALALNKHGMDKEVCFNRKEEKDHGEKGSLVGYKLKEGDKAVIIEDVITAGTALRETIPLIEKQGGKVIALIVAVDRMERGLEKKRATEEIEEEFGIHTHSIININDIIEYLEEREKEFEKGKINPYTSILTDMREYRELYA